MTVETLTPVQIMARVLHEVYCLPGANPWHRYSAAHQQADERRAALALDRLREYGQTHSEETR